MACLIIMFNILVVHSSNVNIRVNGLFLLIIGSFYFHDTSYY